MYKKIILIFLFFFPAIFSLIYNTSESVAWALSDFLENIITITIILIFGFTIPFSIPRLTFQIIGFLIITISALIETSYFVLYKSVINMSTVYILFETNTAESSEFLKTYLEHLSLIIIFLVGPLVIALPLLIKWNKKTGPDGSKSKLKKFRLAAISIGALLAIMGLTSLHRYNLVYTSSKAYIQYRSEMTGYERMGFDPNGGKFSDIKHDYNDKELYVVIIGESLNRNHMSLYGYNRKTSPKLEEIKDELVVYQDVISPFANTTESIPKVLTYGNYENPDAKFDGVIMQLFNKAGFETNWLSNQEPLGIHETYITKIAKACDKRFFENTISNRRQATYDEILLEPFERIINDTADKKLVIVHLLGSHVDYSRRYPAVYNVFSGPAETPFPSETAFNIINAYDNSILYNDFIVREIIEKVRTADARSFVLYFSDHAEDVYKTSNKAYHAEGVNSRHMFEVPLLVWRSEKFLQTSDSLLFDPERPLMTDDLFYGIGDLAGISYKEFDAKRSLFNKAFGQRKRLIINGLDYDIDVKNK